MDYTTDLSIYSIMHENKMHTETLFFHFNYNYGKMKMKQWFPSYVHIIYKLEAGVSIRFSA